MEEEYYTVMELAEHFGVTDTAVYKWINKGLTTSKRREVGKKEHTIIKLEDAEKFLNVGVR